MKEPSFKTVEREVTRTKLSKGSKVRYRATTGGCTLEYEGTVRAVRKTKALVFFTCSRPAFSWVDMYYLLPIKEET